MALVYKKSKTLTVDTNTVDNAEIFAAAQTAGYNVTHTSVTDREIGSAKIVRHSTGVPLLEAAVNGQSLIGSCVIARDDEKDRLSALLKIISNGSCSLDGQEKTDGENRQVRDAMILSAHIRAGRDIFVTNDAKGFISHGRREKLASMFGVRIMTAIEFINHCNAAR